MCAGRGAGFQWRYMVDGDDIDENDDGCDDDQ
jgi:hypothetical protein